MVTQGLRSKLLPIVEINQSQQKDERIRGLSANFENGRIRIDKRMEDLIMEYVRFPRGETKDILDTLEMAVRLVTERPFVYGPGQIPIVRSIPWFGR